MRIAFGMVIRDFLSAKPLTDFLDNAKKYGHPIDRVIVAYSHQCDVSAVKELQARTTLSLIRLQEFRKAYQVMKELRVNHSVIQQLLFCPLLDSYGLVPYGFNRNQVLLDALFSSTDVLIFVDSDVSPSVLRRSENGDMSQYEIDFVGAHLRGMEMGADITGSDYTGYNILPPASFSGMDSLLFGLHKENMTEFWKNSESLGGITLQERKNTKPIPTVKVVGGNLGIRMSAFPKLPPFFSPYYFWGQTPFLARGEDTLLGIAAAQSNIKCMEINAPIFHDTYGDYPRVPSLQNDEQVKTRFYYACTGWIGRNVFLAWKAGISPYSLQRKASLTEGAKALYRYTNDKRFLRLPDIQRAAEERMSDMAKQYRQAAAAWNELTERWYSQ